MKTRKLISLLIAFVMLFSCTACLAEVEVNWNGSTAGEQVKHHTYDEYTEIMKALAEEYPQYATLYSIGHSALERELWCLEISDTASETEKTEIGVFGNIHGGEMESAECAMYFGWWALTNSTDEEVAEMLKNYKIYVVPMINPDGMSESFTYNVRCNLSSRDADGDGVVFSDPYTDVDGDGFIANVYLGESGLDVSTLSFGRDSSLVSLGKESPDWDLDGKMGNDPRSSGVDMNRTFDYMFGYYDITTYNPNKVSFNGYEEASVIGNNAWSSNGQLNGPAYESEIAAVQDFLCETDMAALVTLHTGIQTVLWPWCYREADYENEPEIAQMAEIGKAMAEAASATASSDGVTRNFYYRSSWSDYPTTAEMIDYAYGRLGIHAYTIEVYSSGDSDPEIDSTSEWDGVYLNYDGTYSKGCSWQNGAQLAEKAAAYTVEYTYEQVLGTGEGCLGFSQAQADALGLQEGMSLYFNVNQTAQMSGICPTNMNLMVEAARDAILVMIENEPY